MAKERKKTKDDIKTIECFKKYVESYAAKTNFVRSVSFYEQSSKANFRVVSTLDCGSFQQRIIYYSVFTFEEDFIDVEFAFENSEYSYSFYDIFNLFDIEDFNLYYYSNAEFDEDIENAVKSIFKATENYLYYLEKAGTPDYLPELIKNHETDMDAACGEYDWRDEETDIDDVFFAPENHIIMSIADGPMNEKAIKRLKKVGAKGNLDIIYEKRLLKYIEAGNKVDRKNVVDQEDFERTYARKTLGISVIAFLAFFVVILIASFVCHAILFKGADIYYPIYRILGLSLQMPLERIGLCAGAAFLLTVACSFFSKKLVMKRMPDNMKNRAASKFDKDTSVNFGKFSEPMDVVVCIFALLFAIGCFFASVEDIGYYDDSVKFFSGVFEIADINYEDLEIYKVKGHYDGKDEYVLNENAYAISDSNGNYYNYDELLKDGKTETKLKEIAEKYNKEITEIESIDVLYERFMNDF